MRFTVPLLCISYFVHTSRQKTVNAQRYTSGLVSLETVVSQVRQNQRTCVMRRMIQVNAKRLMSHFCNCKGLVDLMNSSGASQSWVFKIFQWLADPTPAPAHTPPEWYYFGRAFAHADDMQWSYFTKVLHFTMIWEIL
ncbi:hypothetical protein ACQKWADRAFT_307028 [Trichoderma austrokoningii]